jgi:hypothetical protein
VATMLERLGFQKLVNETLPVTRIPRVMTIYQFVLAMVLAIYVGFARPLRLRPRPDLLVGKSWSVRRRSLRRETEQTRG